MVRMQAVRPTHLADMSGCEGVAELVGLPEGGWYDWWGDQAITALALAGGTQRTNVVAGETCATAAVTLCRNGTHASHSVSLGAELPAV